MRITLRPMNPPPGGFKDLNFGCIAEAAAFVSNRGYMPLEDAEAILVEALRGAGRFGLISQVIEIGPFRGAIDPS